MAFGITYELAIVLFIVIFGLLFIVGGYKSLAAPFMQILAAFGIILVFAGWAKKDYDTLFSGIVAFVMSLVLLFSFPMPQKENVFLGAIYPLILPFVYSFHIHPLLFVILLILLAYLLSRIR